MFIRKFYLIKNEINFSHYQYPEGSNKDEVIEGKIKPVLVFHSFKEDLEKTEISEDDYKKILKEQTEIKNKQMLINQRKHKENFESAMEKFNEAGFTKDELKALFKI